MITINLDKAREIHKEKMREARAPKLAELDVAFMRAAEQADATKQSEIAAEKQALRDVTADPDIAAATDVDELKAVWPASLGESPYQS
jgi:hypothetical protein